MDRRAFILTTGANILARVAGTAWSPLAAQAQPAGTVWTIGIINHVVPAAFETGLRDLGWVEDQNVRFVRRTTTDKQKLAQFASELVRMKVDVIFAGNAAATWAASKATETIPIITVSADPVSVGLAASLARPGANVILVFEVSAPEAVVDVTATMAKARPDAFVAAGDPSFLVVQNQLIELVARHRLPAMWEQRTSVTAGGLMAYGASSLELYERAATYIDRILKGAKPGDLPIERATKFELAINLKTARALSLTIPPSLLQRADHVIE